MAYAVATPLSGSVQAAEQMPHPADFSDLIAKVKPAVVSVRVKIDQIAQNSNFDDDNPEGPRI